jgi:DNA polymerase-3 subunit beta
MTYAEKGEAQATSAAPATGALVLAGHLLSAARLAQGASMRRATIPILTHLLLEATDGVLTVQATDMEVHAAATAPAHGSLPSVTVAAAVLVELLSRLPADAEVHLEGDRKLGRLVMKAPGLTIRSMAMPVEDFPAAMEIKPVVSFEMPVASLRRLLTLPAQAISTEETRYYLNGLFLHVSADAEPQLGAVATDGHRLVLAQEALPAAAAGMPSVIVPRGTVSMVRGLLNQRVTGCIRVEVSDTRVRFAGASWTITSKVIDGTFPDWKRVVPRADQAVSRLKVPDPVGFARRLELTAAISTERSRPVRIEKRGRDTTVWIVACSPDAGEAELSMPADVAAWSEDSRPVTAGFQLRYLGTLARAVPSGLTFLIQDHAAPMLAEFPAGLAVLMPMRV